MSGYLYRNAVLFYDDKTESFWSQMTGSAVVGPMTGAKLRWLPCEVTTWGAWKRKHPETTILKPEFENPRYKSTDAFYRQWRKRGRPMFPMAVEIDPAYENMDVLTIVVVDGKARGYPHKELEDGVTKDGDRTIEKKGITVVVRDKQGKQLPTITGYWFAWCAFYKESGTVYKRPK